MAFEFLGRLIRTLGLCRDKPAGHQHLILKVDGKMPSQCLVQLFGIHLVFSAGECLVLVSQLLFEVLGILFIFTLGCTISPATEEGLILPLQMVKCLS